MFTTSVGRERLNNSLVYIVYRDQAQNVQQSTVLAVKVRYELMVAVSHLRM